MNSSKDTTNEVIGKIVSPSINSESFSCPHCGSLTHQYWYTLYINKKEKESLPFIGANDIETLIKNNPKLENEAKERWRKEDKLFKSGKIFFDEAKTSYSETLAYNLHISKCYTCNQIAVWIHDRLLFPHIRTGPNPNKDLPENIKSTYEEARSILKLSPRGAAALLRLAIENICEYLSIEGKDTNEKIGKMVENGLDIRIQQALDIVRVVGNNAVHPGQIDLEDDNQTALKLFTLVNLITEKMISEPKHIQKMYDDILPEGAKKAIEHRDKKI